MSLVLSLLQMFGPALAGLLENLVTRAFTGFPQSALKAGTAAGALIGLMQYMGCDLTLAQEAVIGAVGATPLLFGVPPDQIVPTLTQAMQTRVEQAKKSKQVLADAEAAQKAGKS